MAANRLYKAYGISIFVHCILLVAIAVGAPFIFSDKTDQTDFVEVELLNLAGQGGVAQAAAGQTAADNTLPQNLPQKIAQAYQYNYTQQSFAETVQQSAAYSDAPSSASVASSTSMGSSTGADGMGGSGQNSYGSGIGQSGSGGQSAGAAAGNNDEPAVILKPSVLSQVEPDYPEAARAKGIEGRVGVRVEVNEDGSVGSVSVAGSSGYDDLDAAAVQAVRQWQFVPARNQKTGAAVHCYTRLTVVFRLN